MELPLETSDHLVEASFPMWKHRKEEKTHWASRTSEKAYFSAFLMSREKSRWTRLRGCLPGGALVFEASSKPPDPSEPCFTVSKWGDGADL